VFFLKVPKKKKKKKKRNETMYDVMRGFV